MAGIPNTGISGVLVGETLLGLGNLKSVEVPKTINRHCRDLRMAGRAYEWHSPCRDPLGWCQTVAALKCHHRVCSH